jgi:hypothetical protein
MKITLAGEPVLALSGSLFSLSFFVAYLYGNYITAGANLALAITSIGYHILNNTTSYILDHIALYFVLIRSFVDGYNAGLYGLVIVIVINTYNYIVYFSPYSEWLEYHPNKTIGNFFHSTLHLFAVIGVIAQQYFINEGQRNNTESGR